MLWRKENCTDETEYGNSLIVDLFCLIVHFGFCRGLGVHPG